VSAEILAQGRLYGRDEPFGLTVVSNDRYRVAQELRDPWIHRSREVTDEMSGLDRTGGVGSLEEPFERGDADGELVLIGSEPTEPFRLGVRDDARCAQDRRDDLTSPRTA